MRIIPDHIFGVITGSRRRDRADGIPFLLFLSVTRCGGDGATAPGFAPKLLHLVQDGGLLMGGRDGWGAWGATPVDGLTAVGEEAFSAFGAVQGGPSVLERVDETGDDRSPTFEGSSIPMKSVVSASYHTSMSFSYLKMRMKLSSLSSSISIVKLISSSTEVS